MTPTYPDNSSASQRPISLAMRPDLQVQRVRRGAAAAYVIKDPIRGNYFELLEEEFSVLEALNGQTSWRQLKLQFEDRFPGRRLDFNRFQSLLWGLHRDGLLHSTNEGQGEEFIKRRKQQRRRGLWETLGNPLAIRLRGVDPEPFLVWLYPKCRWMFSPLFVSVCIFGVFAALLLACTQTDRLIARLPEMKEFFAFHNMLLLALALSLTRILHELGHALTCKHFGGECREIGVFFLVFTPCLYCDVSDAWMMRNKWERIAVSAAGIVVELILAALFTFLWYLSQPGAFNLFCLNIMVVCGVSTIPLNANPLLRYDGYYILADLVETPNLWSRSRLALRRLMNRWLWGDASPEELSLRPAQAMLLSAYAVASTVYRWLILAAIAWFLHAALSSRGLGGLAVVLVAIVLAGSLAPPVFRFCRSLHTPGFWKRVSPSRAAMTGCAAVLLLLGVGLLPVRHRVPAEVRIEPAAAARIYVTLPGRLVDAAKAGARVRPGETLGQLVNEELQRERVQVDAERNSQLARLRYLRTVQGDNPEAAAEIPTAEKTLQQLGDRLDSLTGEIRRLRLVSPRAGTVIAPPDLPAAEAAGLDLPQWTGSPLQPANRGCFLRTGALFCLVGEPEACEAVLSINQQDIEFVAPGQDVAIRLDAFPQETFRGKIGQISVGDPQQQSRQERDIGGLEFDEPPQQGPHEVLYQAKVILPAAARTAVFGAAGRARIDAGSRTLASRLYRMLLQTFAFRSLH